MAFRFHRRITLFPGVRLNLSKTGVSVSAGVRGATVTAGKRGVHGNVGLPGTGLSYRQRLDTPQRNTPKLSARPSSTATEQFSLSLGERGELQVHTQSGEPASSSIRRTLWLQHASEIVAFLQSECARINSDAERLQTIHADTPPLATPPPSYSAVPYKTPQPACPVLPDMPEQPTAPRTYFWMKLFPGFLAKRERAFNEAYNAWQQKHQELSALRQQKQQEYARSLAAWQEQKAAHEQLQQAAAEQFDCDIRANPDVMTEQLEHALMALSWPRETHINFEITQQGQDFQLNLDVDLPSGEAFPKQQATFSKTGKRLLVKNKSARKQRMEYARHVHGVVLKIAGVSFVTLPSVHTLTIAAYTQRLDEATGFEADTYLLQAQVSREQWQQLNLRSAQQIDPIAALALFQLNRDMTKTGIFKPIQPK